MTNCNTLRVKLENIKPVINNVAKVTSDLLSNVIGDSNNKSNFLNNFFLFF